MASGSSGGSLLELHMLGTGTSGCIVSKKSTSGPLEDLVQKG